MTVALLSLAWLASLLAVLSLGFRWGKRTPYRETLSGEVSRKVRVGVLYAKATVAVLVPAYKRRWDRKRAEALQAYRDSLQPIKRAAWWEDVK